MIDSLGPRVDKRCDNHSFGALGRVIDDRQAD
jgi:hypothetical protein